VTAATDEAAALACFIDHLSPGATLVRKRRLRGGLGADMHVVNIETAGGARSRFVLRRYRPGEHDNSTPEHAEREYRTLGLLEAASVPAPKPLVLDAEGRFFGVPALALSYLPGRSFPTRVDAARLTHGLAAALLRVHAVTPDRFDLSWLPAYAADELRMKVERRREAAGGEPLAQQIWDFLDVEEPRVGRLPLCLVHEDFWPGNTVWYRGRLAGIVDWTTAEVGDPRVDVAQCRLDLTISHGIEVADAFLDAYQRLAKAPVPEMRFFDLLYGIRALAHYESWLRGYHDAGLQHLTAAIAGERLRAFLRRALAAS
jgi:aminoglycoside phosphotransferase (APT) family kinase protein